MPLQRTIVFSPDELAGRFPAAAQDVLAIAGRRGLLYGHEGHNDLLTFHATMAEIALAARDEESPLVVLSIGTPTLLDSTEKIISYLFEHTAVERVLVLCTTDIPDVSDVHLHAFQFDRSVGPVLLNPVRTTTKQRYWMEVVSIAQAVRSGLSRQAA